MTHSVPHTVEATFEHLGRVLRSPPKGDKVMVRTIPSGFVSEGGLHLPQQRFYSGPSATAHIRALVLADCGKFRAGQVVQFSRSMFVRLYEVGPHDFVGTIPSTAIYAIRAN